MSQNLCRVFMLTCQVLVLLITAVAAGEVPSLEQMRRSGVKVNPDGAIEPASEALLSINMILDGKNTTRSLRLGESVPAFTRGICRELGHSVHGDQCAKLEEDIRIEARRHIPRLAHAKVEDWYFTRTALIKLLQSMYPARYRRYLEVGCGHEQRNFREVKGLFDVAECVDPVHGSTIPMTSDDFFAHNTREWDIIFVDGLHLEEQVLRDVHNALRWLSPGGTVVMHDCVPRTVGTAGRESSIGTLAAWNGDVWKAALRLRAMRGVEMVVVDVDEGCGVLRKAPPFNSPTKRFTPSLPEDPFLTAPLDYEVDFMGREVDLLQLKTVQDVHGWLQATEDRRDAWLDDVTSTLTVLDARLENSISDHHTRDMKGPQQPDPSAPSSQSSPAAAAAPQTLTLRVQGTYALDRARAEDDDNVFVYFTHQCIQLGSSPSCQRVSNDTHVARPATDTPTPPTPPHAHTHTTTNTTGPVFEVSATGMLPDTEEWGVYVSSWLWDPLGNVTCCAAAAVVRHGDVLVQGKRGGRKVEVA